MSDYRQPTEGPWTPLPGAAPAGYGTPPPGYLPAWPTTPAYGQMVPTSALASPWIRLGASLLNMLLIIVTLGIGYLVWTLVLWNEGTNPAKKMLGLRVVKSDTGRVCHFGDMLIRNFVMGGLVLGLLNVITFSIISLVDALMIFGDRRQRLVDRMSGTLVVKIN